MGFKFMKTGSAASFGAQLKALRKAAGFTQEELATIAGLSVHGVSALERGERRRPHAEPCVRWLPPSTSPARLVTRSWERPGAEPRCEHLALEVLHHDVHLALVITDVMQHADVGVVGAKRSCESV